MARALLSTAATVALLAGLLGGCDSEAPSTDPAPSPTPTPLAEVATDTVAVVREGFCERVAPAALEAALGGAPDDADAWSNGERARLAPGVRDVAHEYGCAWTAGAGAQGTSARAWVFAPPVTTGQAERLRRDAAPARGCDPIPDAPAFGTRDAAVRCGDEVRFQGLFGDAWLSCSLRASGPDLLERAEQWCATVLQAAAAG